MPHLPHAPRGPVVGRRAVLVGMAALGLSACLPKGMGGGGAAYFGIADPAPVDGLPDDLFTLGVASGDPTPDGFVLWTRLAPNPLAGGGMGDLLVSVRWQLALDPGFTELVADGLVKTSTATAHSVHITTSGLPPDTWFYYRFTTGGQVSPTGRTRTAPASGSMPEQLRLAVATCQNWKDGYYHAWSDVVDDAPDLVVFLGDYIYESGVSGRVRPHNSAEIISLAEYRNRYALYKGDPALQAAHAAVPWVVTWDDHEVENNYAGLIPQDRADDPIFAQRRADAYRAFWEHMPVRGEPAEDGSYAVVRALRWGGLADLLVLDGRQYRSDQVCGISGDIGTDCDDRRDPTRTMLGAAQSDWLEQQLAGGTGRWSVLANQTIMTPMPFGSVFNNDQWDGYAAERTRVLGWLEQTRNPVVLTGDFHAGGMGRLRDEAAGSPTIGTEIVTTSLTSQPDAATVQLVGQIVAGLEQFPWFDGLRRGYTRHVVTPDVWDVDFVAVDAVSATPSAPDVLARWRITDGNRTAQART